jgi:hypothetical protein
LTGATNPRSKPRDRDRSGLRGTSGFNVFYSDHQLAQDEGVRGVLLGRLVARWERRLCLAAEAKWMA